MRLALLALACALGAPATASDTRRGCAPNLTVNNANDTGNGSLRQAVLLVCPAGTITFAERFEIQLEREIVIDQAVTIDGTSVSDSASGLGGNLVQINGGLGHRSFLVDTNGDLTLKRLRVSNGVLEGGDLGGAVNNRGQLTVTDCRFDSNRSGPASGLGGGAIFNAVGASLRVDGSTFDGNSASRGAAIFNSGSAELFNSTFSDNVELVNEGAIQNRGTLLAVHITVANNGREGAFTGGLFAFNAGSTSTLVNSIFADNKGLNCQISGGTSASFAVLNESGNCEAQSNADPQLLPLAGNGGVTQTLVLGPDSPAFGAGDAAFCLPTDQRGRVRAQVGGCDLGAVEQNFVFADSYE